MTDKVSKSQLQEMITQAARDAVAEQTGGKAGTNGNNESERKGYGPAILSSRQKERRTAPKEPGMGAARLVRSLAAAKGDPERALKFCKRAYNDDLGDTVGKALAAGDLTAGGFMVPEDLREDIIPLLRNRTVVRRAGVETVPMPNGTLTMPKETGDVSATYVGENQNITATEPTGGQIVMSAKKLAALTPISNDLLDYDVGDAADRWVRNSLTRNISVREDQAFIRDQGSEWSPKGMRYWAANVTSSNGTSSDNIESDFTDLIQDLEGANVDMSNPVWIMAPRSKNYLINLRDGNGNLIYPELRNANPTIHTFPVFITNNIPTNLGGGGDETELYLVNVPDAMIGEAGGMEITVDTSAAYVQGGNLQSAFSMDQTVVRAIMRHDFAMAYDASVAVKNEITWGA